jgi:hypothetical protein
MENNNVGGVPVEYNSQDIQKDQQKHKTEYFSNVDKKSKFQKFLHKAFSPKNRPVSILVITFVVLAGLLYPTYLAVRPYWFPTPEEVAEREKTEYEKDFNEINTDFDNIRVAGGYGTQEYFDTENKIDGLIQKYEDKGDKINTFNIKKQKVYLYYNNKQYDKSIALTVGLLEETSNKNDMYALLQTLAYANNARGDKLGTLNAINRILELPDSVAMEIEYWQSYKKHLESEM